MPCPILLLSALGLVSAIAATAPSPVDQNPNVLTPSGEVIGRSEGGVDVFAGIPYAQPPVGNLRLRPPQRIRGHIGTITATSKATACPQQRPRQEDLANLQDVLPFLPDVSGVITPTLEDGEDCLTVTIARPVGTTSQDKLPVLFYIFGGSFSIGSTEDFDPSEFIRYGSEVSKPFIFVAVNYRVNGFGFLPGRRVLEDGAANLGLLDQRLGLEWTAENIANFGGDPERLTLWGVSAGSISVFDQLALYGGNNSNTITGAPLFRAAIMSSGSMIPAGSVASEKAERVYQRVVQAAGCEKAPDSLQCLREVDYETFLTAVSTVPGPLSYNGFALTYLPRPDGKSLPESPETLARQGRYAAVPMMIGSMEDEGTTISILQRNLTTVDLLANYLQRFLFPEATRSQLTTFANTYGVGKAGIVNGSPFHTGLANEIFPGFKRRAAVIGDFIFSLMRRLFLRYTCAAHPDVPSWSYLGSFARGTPIVGTGHGSDGIQVFIGNSSNYVANILRHYFINFVYSLDPNGDRGREWPNWASGQQQLQIFASKQGLIKDKYRSKPFDWIAHHIAVLHV